MNEEYKIAGETIIKKDGDPEPVVVEVIFDLPSNQVSFYTDQRQGNINLHIDKEDLKRLLAAFDEVDEVERLKNK